MSDHIDIHVDKLNDHTDIVSPHSNNSNQQPVSHQVDHDHLNDMTDADLLDDDSDGYATNLITISKIEHKQLTFGERMDDLKKFIYLFITFQSTLDPNTTFKICWDWMIILLVTYSAFVIPFYMSFDQSLAHSVEYVDLFCTICMFCDIFLNFRTGYVDYNGNIVYDSKLITTRYYQTGLIYDICGTIPFDLFSSLFDSRYDTVFVSNCLKGTNLIRTWRLLYNPRLTVFNSPQARIGKLLFGFFWCAHLFGAAFFFVGKYQVNTSTSWLIQNNLLHASLSAQYVASLYWALTTMVTVGYGDIHPTTFYEQITVIPILIISALIYATIFGNMAYAIETLSATYRRYQNKIDHVKEFVNVYEIPIELHQKLTDYTNEIWNQTKGFETEHMLANLPTSVKADIMMYLNHTLIQRVPLFKQCTDRFLEAIILRMYSQVCLTNDYVFKEGDKSREMYFVRSGTVEIIMEDGVSGTSDRVIAEIGSFSESPYFGEISLLLGETRTASARAKTKCVFSCLTQHDFFDVLSMFPDEENTLRETATARLEADIQREQAALKLEQHQLGKKMKERGTSYNYSSNIQIQPSHNKLMNTDDVQSSSSRRRPSLFEQRLAALQSRPGLSNELKRQSLTNNNRPSLIINSLLNKPVIPVLPDNNTTPATTPTTDTTVPPSSTLRRRTPSKKYEIHQVQHTSADSHTDHEKNIFSVEVTPSTIPDTPFNSITTINEHHHSIASTDPIITTSIRSKPNNVMNELLLKPRNQLLKPVNQSHNINKSMDMSELAEMRKKRDDAVHADNTQRSRRNSHVDTNLNTRPNTARTPPHNNTAQHTHNNDCSHGAAAMESRILKLENQIHLFSNKLDLILQLTQKSLIDPTIQPSNIHR